MGKIPACLILIGCLALPVRAGMNIHGYVKSFALVFFIPDALALEQTNPPLGMVSNRLRLKMTTAIKSNIHLEAAWDLSPRFSGSETLEGFFGVTGITGDDYRISNSSSRLVPAPGDPESGFSLHHNLDRLFATFRLKGADLYVGRQAISWGSARTINPTDVIAPFAFNELDTEDRHGVDAIRLRVPLGMMDEIDIGWVAGRNFKFDESALFLRTRISLLKTDTSLLFMAFRGHLMVGVDLARSIGGAGAWCEAAWVKPDAFHSNHTAGERPYFRASLGLDYSFSGKVYSFTEYHFNGAGSGTPESYSALPDATGYRDGTVYLMGRHYLSLGATVQVTPLLPVTLVGIWNLSDGSLSISLSGEFNVAENIYLATGIYLGAGASPERIPGGIRYPSEFGTWPHMCYTAFRYYF